MDIISYILSRKYTQDTADALGAVKGAPCTVKSIEDIIGGKRVTLEWEGTSGTKQTQSFDVMDGEDGDSIEWTQIQNSGTKIAEVNIDGNITSVYAPAGGSGSANDVVGTLQAGETSITLRDENINQTSVLNFYTDIYGVSPTSVTVANGSVTLTFNSQSDNMGVMVRVTNANVNAPYSFKDYLEVTEQGAYIDTGVANTSTSYFEVDFQYTGTPTNNDGIFGAMGSGIEFVINSYGDVSYAMTGTSRALFTATNLDRHVIKADNNGIFIDNNDSGATVNWSSATGYNYYIFAFNYLNSTLYQTGHAKIYSVKIYDDDTLVRYFVPAVRNIDGEIGMYDRITDTFYTNAGTGSFIVN